MKINILNFFRKENNLQKIYSRSSFEVLSVSRKSYPFFASLESSNIHAYSTRFMLKPNDVKKIENKIELFFRKKMTQEKECLSYNGKTLHYFRFKEFNQAVIDIITNDNHLIKSLCDENLEPPAPHVVFPDCDFETLGSLQGDMELWWDIYWSPFWEYLTEEEKTNYLERNNIPGKVSEFLILHR